MNLFTVRAIQISWAVCHCRHRPGRSHFKLRSQRSACEVLVNTSFHLHCYGTTRSNPQQIRCWISVGLLSCGINASPSDSASLSVSLSVALILFFLGLFWLLLYFVCEPRINWCFTSWINCWPCFSLLVSSRPAAALSCFQCDVEEVIGRFTPEWKAELSTRADKDAMKSGFPYLFWHFRVAF